MIKHLIFLWMALIFFSANIYAQKGDLDNLLKQAYAARLKGDYDSNFRLLREAENIDQSNQDPLLLAKLYAELSKQHLILADYNKAKAYAEKSLQIGKQANHTLAKSYGYIAISTYHNYLDIGDQAVSYAQQALKLLDDEPDPSLQSRAYYILYGVYSRWDDVDLCEKYAQLAIAAAKQGNDNEMLSNAYAAYATAMEFRYDRTNQQRYLDSIKIYLHKSAAVYKQAPETVGIRTYSITNINLANFFFKYHPLDQSSTQDSILYYAGIAQRLSQASDKNYTIMGSVNGLLAEVASLQGNDQLAEAYLMDSYIHLTETTAPSYYTLAHVAQGLSDLHRKRGDYEKALFYQKKKEQFTDTIFNETQMLQTKKLEVQYENKKLLEDIQLSAQKARNQKTQNLLLAGICVLLLMSLFLLRNSFKNKTQLQDEKALRLHQEKMDSERNAALQLKMQQQEQARLQAEQQLLLIQKEQMQKEAMADALQIERKNRLLLQLKDKLKKLETEDNKGLVEKVIKEEMRLEETVERSAREFESINPLFFSRLRELSGERLTPLELKHCAYLYLKLNTKEIAAAFYVEPKTIRVSKYRIKQKLRLDKDTDLDDFLQDIG